jgi:hypothetical protein
VYDERLSRHFNSWNPKFVEVPERITDPFAVCEKYQLVERCKRIEVILILISFILGTDDVTIYWREITCDRIAGI